MSGGAAFVKMPANQIQPHLMRVLAPPRGLGCSVLTKSQFLELVCMRCEMIGISLSLSLPPPAWTVSTLLSHSVLAFLAIYRQIRDFGLTHGDRIFALAIDRQSPKIGDFEPQTLAILANFRKTWRFRRNTERIGQKNPK